MTATLRHIKVMNEMVKLNSQTRRRPIAMCAHRSVEGKRPRIRMGLSAGLNRRLARASADYERQHRDKAHETKRGRKCEDRAAGNEYPVCGMHDCTAEKTGMRIM